MNSNNFDSSVLNYVIYCRKSSDSEDKQVQSLETQIRELTDHAKKNELNVVEVIQESKSAFKTGRDGFNKIVKLLSTGKVNALLVVRANRISRNAIDAGQIINLMDNKKLLYIRTPSSTCYTSSSTDKMMVGLELLISKKDSDDKGDMVKEGQKTKALKGYPHGLASLGFLNDMSDEKGNRKWKVDKVRIEKIRTLLRMFLTGGWTAGKLFDFAVNDLGLTTVARRRIGGALIVKSRIYTILKDPIYAGFFFYGGQRYELSKTLPRLITESEHLKILRLLGLNSLPRIKEHQTVYSGMIHSLQGYLMAQDVKTQVICDCKRKFSSILSQSCPDCGTNFSEMSSPVSLEYVYYYDSRKKKAKQKYKYLPQGRIEDELIKEATSFLTLSPSLVDWSKKHIHELKDKDLEETLVRERNIEEDKLTFESEKGKIREMFRKGHMSENDYKYDLLQLEDRYKYLKKNRGDDVDWMSKLEEIMDLTESFATVLQSGLDNQKKEVLLKFGANLTWDNEKLCISWSKPILALKNGLKGIQEKLPEFEPKYYLVDKGLNEKTAVVSTVFSSVLRG